MRLELPPLIQPGRIDRLADLFGACRAHRPFRLVEVHAGLFEGQAAMVENTADFAFEIGHDILMLNAQDLAGQHRVPMVHQVDIAAIIVPDILQAVAELLAFGEELLEAGKTAGHRLAARIDDLRIRQDQMDEPDMPEIVRHLVGEVGRALAVDGGIVDIVAAKRFKLAVRQLVQDARIAITVTDLLAPAQPVGEREDVGQFQRAVDVAVRCLLYTSPSPRD